MTNNHNSDDSDNDLSDVDLSEFRDLDNYKGPVHRKHRRKTKNLFQEIEDEYPGISLVWLLGGGLIGVWAFCSVIGVPAADGVPPCPLWLAWPIAVLWLLFVARCGLDFLKSLAPPSSDERPTQEDQAQTDDHHRS